MPFTAKGLATRSRIIEGVSALLRDDDAHAVTLDEMRAATRTSKGQLFHYFPGGKEELLLEVARFEADRVLEDQQPHLGALDSWDSWQAWREAVVARYRAQGAQCPLATLMGEVGSVPGAQEVVVALLRNWQQQLRRGIARMQERGEVTANLDPERTAAAFVAAIQGGVALLRSTGDIGYLESALDLSLAQLRSLALSA
jgi:AcrR family transcriptional regulator